MCLRETCLKSEWDRSECLRGTWLKMSEGGMPEGDIYESEEIFEGDMSEESI